MDDDRSIRAWLVAALFAPALVVVAGTSASAQSFHGSTQVQYQSVDRSQSLPTTDTWAKILQLDYARRLPGAVDLSSSFRFVETNVARQSDRLRAPEGTVRLAHRNFGFTTGYRPVATRDARGISTRQQSMSMTGYLQKDGLPRLTGSWVRSHLDSSILSPSSATVTRSLGASYGVRALSVRAAYGDRSLDGPSEVKPRLTDRHVSLGSSSQFQAGRVPISVYYDFTEGHAYPSVGQAVSSRSHTAGTSTGFPITTRTATALSYSYRYTQTPSVVGATQEHNGAASLSHALSPIVQLSAGGGLRSLILAGRPQTEQYLATSAAAQGEARPGWRLNASLSHSVNWLPRMSPRAADNFEAGTTMRLAKGLDVRGSFGASTSRQVASDGLIGPRQYTTQSGAGMAAFPLRFLYLDGSVSRSRSGPRLFAATTSATSYGWGVRLSPHARLQTSGRWGVTEAPGTRGSSFQGSAQLVLRSSFQISGGYSRAKNEVALPVRTATRQESLTGTMTMALARDLNGSVQYGESNLNRPNRVRQLTVNVVHTFGR